MKTNKKKGPAATKKTARKPKAEKQLSLLPEATSAAETPEVMAPATTSDAFERWKARGQILAAHTSSALFELGDWFLEGAEKYAENIEEAALASGMSVQYLRNIAVVCRRFPKDQRKELLSFEHHRLLAPVADEQLEPIVQRIVKEELSAAALRQILPKKEKKTRKSKADETTSSDEDEGGKTDPEDLAGAFDALDVKYRNDFADCLIHITSYAGTEPFWQKWADLIVQGMETLRAASIAEEDRKAQDDE